MGSFTNVISFVNRDMRSSLVVQGVKDLALSLQRLGSLLWSRFDPWPRNFCMAKKKGGGDLTLGGNALFFLLLT